MRDTHWQHKIEISVSEEKPKLGVPTAEEILECLQKNPGLLEQLLNSLNQKSTED